MEMPAIPSQPVPEAPGDRDDRGERVVDLVPQHADEPLPGQTLLLAKRAAQIGEHEQVVR